MNEKTLRVAAEVIGQAGRERPADAVLRETLKREGLSQETSREISQLVFAFYRWRGWLNSAEPLFDNLKAAWALVEEFLQQPESFSDEELLSKAVPDWTKEQVEISSAWTRSLQEEPRLWLRAKRGTAETVMRKLGSSQVTQNAFLPCALDYRGEEDLFRTPEFHTGEFELQDISSQAVSVVCDPRACETWWDACAGEGGKLLHLSDLMENKGLIWASDRAAWRLKNLKRRTARARVFNYRAVPWDGGAKLPTKNKFDGVLVDAPCSGIGTWQRNPHARWTTTLADVLELAEIQKRLLQHVSVSVKPGGKLFYSVCTLSRAETVEVAETFSRLFPDFQPCSMKNPFRPTDAPKPMLWFWPQDCGGNGMFVAAWQKSGG